MSLVTTVPSPPPDNSCHLISIHLLQLQYSSFPSIFFIHLSYLTQRYHLLLLTINHLSISGVPQLFHLPTLHFYPSTSLAAHFHSAYASTPPTPLSSRLFTYFSYYTFPSLFVYPTFLPLQTLTSLSFTPLLFTSSLLSESLLLH